MDSATQARVTVQKAEDLWRLCHQAEAKGIRILCEPSTMQHFSTSATDPTILYRVSESGCSCRGFQAWHRCQHFVLFLASLGRIPDLEQDIVVDEHHSERCRTCRGEGFIRAYVGGGLNDWTMAPCHCTRQHAAA